MASVSMDRIRSDRQRCQHQRLSAHWSNRCSCDLLIPSSVPLCTMTNYRSNPSNSCGIGVAVYTEALHATHECVPIVSCDCVALMYFCCRNHLNWSDFPATPRLAANGKLAMQIPLYLDRFAQIEAKIVVDVVVQLACGFAGDTLGIDATMANAIRFAMERNLGPSAVSPREWHAAKAILVRNALASNAID